MHSAGQAAGSHALVFGASGIKGWAIVNAILEGYPEPSDFSRVTALTNRPLSHEVAQWPRSDKLNIGPSQNLRRRFGLSGVAPTDGPGPDPSKYVSENREQWLELESKHGLQPGRVENGRSVGLFPYFIMTMMDFDRQLDLTKLHDAWSKGGTVEETNTKGAWYTALDRFRVAKIIP